MKVPTLLLNGFLGLAFTLSCEGPRGPVTVPSSTPEGSSAAANSVTDDAEPNADEALKRDLQEQNNAPDGAKHRARPAPRSIGPGMPLGGRMAPPPPQQYHTEDYAPATETGFQLVQSTPLSTFSIDTDTASYSNVRRILGQGQRPPRGAVRIEELINYFSYEYPEPSAAHPFSATAESATCPWNSNHELVRIGLKARSPHPETRKAANLVLLLDVSGSMDAPNKLPLLQRSLGFAVNQLGERDRVAIVVYAGASGEVLASTPFADRARILAALDSLQAGGSTNAGEGIELAYDIARKNFVPGGINRVILATDGDFNVGVTDKSSLVDLVKNKAKEGVFLTVLGFGMGNLKDDMLEKLADNGNGSYAYIDDFAEARKVFGEQIGGTLETVAKDVKIQVEFNPRKVSAYRLIGYENRRLNAEDFNDDTKDAGEIGAGHTVTALYEVVPVGKPIGPNAPKVDPLKYQQTSDGSSGIDEWMTVKLRYKEPTAERSSAGDFPFSVRTKAFTDAPADFRFAAAVAAFGLVLTESKDKGSATLDGVLGWAQGAIGEDPYGHRKGFVELVAAAKKAGRAASGSGCACTPGDPLCDCF